MAVEVVRYRATILLAERAQMAANVTPHVASTLHYTVTSLGD